MLSPPDLPSNGRLPIYGHAEYDWSVRGLDGTQIAVSDFKGKVVFLNLWATWCLPCIAEMPSIQSLIGEFNEDDVVFLVLTDENAETVEKFLGDSQLDLPVYMYDDLPDSFRAPGVPTTYVINRDGLIVFRHVGAAKWDGEGFRTFIQRLM